MVLDGGGQGKNDDQKADIERLLLPGGTLVMDDFQPADRWPPPFGGKPDRPRMHWLEHPSLAAVEIRLAADLASIVAVRHF